MRLRPDLFVRAGLVLGLLAFVGVFAQGALGPVVGAIALVALLGSVALLMLGYLSRPYFRRIVPTWDEEFPVTANARIRPGGEFEWTPVGTPRIQVRHGIVHRWWDAEKGPRFDAALAFDVPDEVAPRELEAATRGALKAATRALPGRGKVRAKAAARDVSGPTSLVRVRLAVQGAGAEPEWCRLASAAFAKEFLRHLAAEGHASVARPR